MFRFDVFKTEPYGRAYIEQNPDTFGIYDMFFVIYFDDTDYKTIFYNGGSMKFIYNENEELIDIEEKNSSTST